MKKGIEKKGNVLYIDYDMVTSDAKYKLTHVSGPVIQEPDTLREYLASFDIIGAVIKEISCITESEQPPFTFYDGKMSIDSVQSPFVVITNKGAFEIDYSESSTVIFSKNKIKSKYYYTDGSKCVRKLFASLRGIVIEDVIIREQDYTGADHSFTGSYGLRLDKHQKSYIKSLDFKLSTGQILRFKNLYDDGMVALLTAEGKMVQAPDGLNMEV